MRVDRIAEDLWRWTAFHEEWKQDVGCVYYEGRDAICLVDPLVPAGDARSFLTALDRDVRRVDRPVHVLLTVYWHTRSAREIAARYGAQVWAPSRARKAVERRAGQARAFRPGELLPGGVVALPTARSSEAVLFVPEHRTLIAGDVILGAEGGGLRLCPASWLPEGVGQGELRASLRPLLELPVERVLVSHGEAVLEGGHDALARLLAG